ncbi:MAG: T9SS type A sorting domain-containing protein [Fluviicola sp.]|nr:T9SS type A sorting domain-containing protein [Fluviicola sp.]
MKQSLLLVFLLLTSILLSQHNNEFFNNGALVFVSAGEEVHVLGDVHMTGATATLTNNGLIKTQGNSYSDNLFQQRGTGTYLIENSNVNIGERQFIEGSYAVRGGQGLVGVNSGAFYNLELANDQGIVYLVSSVSSLTAGQNLVADVVNQVDFNPAGAPLLNRIITHDIGLTGAITYPANGSNYSSVFGVFNAAPSLVPLANNTVSLNGAMTGVDNGYIQGRFRRAISSAGGIYGFVLGVEPAAAGMQRGMQYSRMNFTANNYDVVTGYFQSASPNTGGSVVECSGNTINYWGGADHGEWVYRDYSGGAGTGDYDLTVWPQDDNFIIATVWVITKDNTLQGTANGCGPSPIGLSRSGFNSLTNGSGFSEFGLAAPISALPIELESIKAVGVKDHINVEWKVASEINLSHYELERSEDGFSFDYASTTQAQGNSQSLLIYDYDDYDVRYFTEYFYRLKSVDFDGSYDYSPIVSASIANSNLSFSADAVSVYPNPTMDDFVISITVNENVDLGIKILNALGQLIQQKDIEISNGKSILPIDSYDWTPGVYFIEITDKYSERTITKRIIKQ